MAQLPEGFILEEELQNSGLPEGFVLESPKQGILSRLQDDISRRSNQAAIANLAYKSGEQSLFERELQRAGAAGGLANDIAGEALGLIGSGVSFITPEFIERPVVQGAKNVSNFVAASPVGDLARSGLAAYADFSQENPRAARNINALGNIGAVVAATTPVGGASALNRVGQATMAGGKVAGKAAANLTIQPVAKLAGILNKMTDDVASGVSGVVNRADLPPIAKGLSDAEALFVQTLKNEGVSFDEALKSLQMAKQFNVSPSVSITSNIPSMQRQAFMTSQGSAGSKVAAEAVRKIDRDIPILNERIIKEATGGKSLGAEEYGTIVAQEAKKLVDNKANTLKTRAKPFYQSAVGVDKSVPQSSKTFQRMLENPLAVKALDDFRTDPVSLTNVKNELVDLGVDAADLETLPLNSTVSLHGARVHLRRMADNLFKSGDTQGGMAVKSAINAIDETIEESFPNYKRARRIYSEDAGILKKLKDSPVGKMSTFAEGNYSQIANDLMKKDAGYIKRFSDGIDNQKMKDSIAGAFLRRQLEDAGNDGRLFSDKVFKTPATKQRLEALVGEDRFNKMQKVDNVIEQLIATRNIRAGSQTAANEAAREGMGDIPRNLTEVILSVKNKVAPSLMEMVRRDPKQAARFNELLFTDEGYKLLEKLNSGKRITKSDIDNIGDFVSKNIDKTIKTTNPERQ